MSDRRVITQGRFKKAFPLLALVSIFASVALAAGESVFRVSAPELAAAISERRTRVAEFKFLQDWGKKHGIRIYAAGGTAAGLAHYVKQDLEREWHKARGEASPYFESRFGYDYYDLYRSTQDADIVIDAPGKTAEEHERIARELEHEIQALFPHTQGSKTVWEVRFLKVARGSSPGAPDYKDALLGDDFLKQNSDSHSTGLVEITKSKSPVVRDVKAWAKKTNPFFEDIVQNRLTYYDEPTHFKTLRAAKGINPKILSVIRYYTKAFQYGVDTNPEQEAILRQIIDEFDPTRIENDYVRKQIEKNALKLFWHARDVELAWNTLERMGLRQKLVQAGAKTGENAMGIWLDREPLRSKPVGDGRGKTAAEMGITVVAHETNQILAYESITRSTKGVPNVFISRYGFVNEEAAHGDGFYTQIGRKGARGTGLTIRFEVDPKAREGHDFIKKGQYVVILNRNAIRIIDESVEVSPQIYFRLLFEQEGVDDSDRGLFEMFRRKVNAQVSRITREEADEIAAMMREHVAVLKKKKQPKNFHLNWDALAEWFRLPVSAQYPEIAETLMQDPGTYSLTIAHILSEPHWASHVGWVEELLKRDEYDIDVLLSEHVLSKPYYADHPEWIETLLERVWQNPKLGISLITDVLSQPQWAPRDDWVMSLLKNPRFESAIITHILSQPHWANHSDLVETILKTERSDRLIAMNILSEPHSAHRADWVKTILKRGNSDDLLVQCVLSKPFWVNHPEWSQWIDTLLKRKAVNYEIATSILSQPQSASHPEWAKALLKSGDLDEVLAESALSKPHWVNHPELIEALIKKGQNDREVNRYIIQYILSEQHWAIRPEWIKTMLRRTEQYPALTEDFVEKALSQPHWREHPALRKLCGGNEPELWRLRQAYDEEDRNCSRHLRAPRR